MLYSYPFIRKSYMKLVIQIPAYNEADSIAETVKALPETVWGFSEVECLVIDDGSVDDTAKIASDSGAHHVLSLGANMGLARAFSAGIECSLKLGADVIVNTDADNQYCAEDIITLVRPILNGRTQIVVGARPISEIDEFSVVKKILQKFGSWVVRKASDTRVEDAPSGFRAYSRNAAAQLHVVNNYTYTLETIIQAGRKRIPISSVPVRVNIVTRPSRLFSSIGEYVFRSMVTILRIYVLYKPLKFFFSISSLVALPAFIGISRFIVEYALGDGAGHVQSLVLSGGLLAIASVIFAVGIIADLIAANRGLLEDIRARELLRESGLPHKDDLVLSGHVSTFESVKIAR